MYEYNVPDELHTELTTHPSRLMSLAIGMLGDYAANICDIPISVRLDRQDQSSDLNFPAYYFDAYYQARLGTTIQPYIKLLGSASYYLSNLPGGALVLIKDIESNGFDLDASGFEHLIFSILRGDADIITVNASRFETELTELNGNLSVYRKTGLDSEPLFISINNLRNQVYRQGSARELLFVDVAGALIRVMYENSCWRCLPEYSNLPVSIWENTIKRASFIKELWPAQRLLGKQGVFEGRSAVIQMPTSAGKTRATEIIIRSAFLAK